jgi:hypothetical protein
MRTGMLGIDCEALGSQLAGFLRRQGRRAGAFGREGFRRRKSRHARRRRHRESGRRSGDQVHEITSLVRAARSKRTFPVVVVRDKKEVTLNVTL